MCCRSLGQLVVETARGQEKLRTLQPEEMREILCDISCRTRPAIERIRSEQRPSHLLIDAATNTNW